MKLRLSLPDFAVVGLVGAHALSAARCFPAQSAPVQQGVEAVAAAEVETVTDDRLRMKGRWPTKGSFSRSAFAGSEDCALCHAAQTTTQPGTPMGKASERSPQFALLRQHPMLDLREGSQYTIADADITLPVAVEWAFGSGRLGQTYLYRQDGKWYESQVSFFTGIQELDLTVGHAFHPDASLRQELGKELDQKDVIRGFQCHTSFAVSAGTFDPDHAVPGLECEMCHGRATEHMRRMSAAGGTAASDPRITCVACHAPHRPLVHAAEHYNRRCVACHRADSSSHFPAGVAKILSSGPRRLCCLSHAQIHCCRHAWYVY